jgi:mono/diheme cytochrome c family protein
MSRVWMALKIFAGVTLVALVGVAAYVWRTWDKVWDVPSPELHATKDPESIARGEYLVFGPAHCVECHTANVEEYDAYYAGGPRPALTGGFKFVLGPLGSVYSKNITPDPETGIGRYSDPQVARMLRHSVRPDGKASISEFMPFSNMSDQDIVDILSFLRSQPPVRKEVPLNEWTTFGKVIKTFAPVAQPRLDGTPARIPPPSEATSARGEYLARGVANCAGCHTSFDLMTGRQTGPRFAGGGEMEPMLRKDVDPTVFFQPPNVTPRVGSALLRFPDRATFVARFKVGGRKYPGSPMPWESYSRMSENDIAAIYEFLHGLEPAGEPSLAEPTVKQE